MQHRQEDINQEAAAAKAGFSVRTGRRSGRRSACAAFILRERGIKAYSMRGGIKKWSYEVEGFAV